MHSNLAETAIEKAWLRHVDAPLVMTRAPVKCQSIVAHAVHRKWLVQTEKQMENL